MRKRVWLKTAIKPMCGTVLRIFAVALIMGALLSTYTPLVPP